MSNYEHIKSMTMTEMAKFFCEGEFGCSGCAGQYEKSICKREQERITKWLEEEKK